MHPGIQGHRHAWPHVLYRQELVDSRALAPPATIVTPNQLSNKGNNSMSITDYQYVGVSKILPSYFDATKESALTCLIITFPVNPFSTEWLVPLGVDFYLKLSNVAEELIN